MASLFWVGGAANWNTTGWSTTSGGASGHAAPTASDDAFLDNGTGHGNVTIPTATTVVCRSLNTNDGAGGAYVDALVFSTTTSVLTIGDATAGASNVAMKLSSGTTVTLNGIGTINFISTSATQQTIDNASKQLPNVTINGVGSSYLFTSSGTNVMGCSAFTLTAGTYETGLFAHSVSSLTTSGAGTKVLTLTGSIQFGVTGTNNALSMAGTNQTLNANTSTLTFTQTVNTPNFGTGLTWYNVTSPGAGGSIIGTLSCSTYTRTGSAVKTDKLILAGNLTCSTAFIVNSNSLTNRVWVKSSTTGTQRTITAATFTVTNVVSFQDILGAGAATWTVAASGATELEDCQGNSGITFTVAKNRYGVVAGNFSTTATWAATTGGSAGASVPLAQDSVFLDVNSAAGTYTNDMDRVGNVDCTGFTRTFQVSSVGTGYFGNFTLASGMTVSQNNVNTFYGRGSQTITFAGKSLNTSTFDCFGGTYTQQDASSYTGTGQLAQLSGTYATGSFNVTCVTLSSSGTNTRVLNMGSSSISLTGTATGVIWNAVSTGLTYNGAAAAITISNTATVSRTFAGGGFIYGQVTYNVAGSTGALLITGANYFDTLVFSDASNARTLTLTTGIASLTTVRNFNVAGTSGKLMTVNSSTGGTQAFIEIQGTPTNDFLTVTDVVSTLPYKFYAGVNSTSTGTSLNIILTATVTEPYMVRQFSTAGSATTTTSSAFPFGKTASAGELLIVYWAATTTVATSITGPSGYTLIDNTSGATTANSYMWYKVATGGETGAVTISTSSSHTATTIVVTEIAGWVGTPTLDVFNHTNDSGSGLTALATPSITNTAQPAYAIAGWSHASSAGAWVSLTNNWQITKLANGNADAELAALPLLATGAQTTTDTWTNSVRSSTVAAIFKDVATAAGKGSILLLMGIG